MKAKQGISLEQHLLAFILRNRLLTGGQRLVVAVSGGPDSVCLLYSLYNIRHELGIKLHVAHLDHRLRGAAAEADARYVTGLARRLELPATIESRDVPDYQKRHRLSPEEAAREVRYQFLAEVAKAAGARTVAVGHTRDDHVETVLMHLIRGSGTRGMRGLIPENQWPSPKEKLTIIRPLLEITREETSAYCHKHNLEPRQDASNMSISPLRNRIRLELLPFLQKFNPNIAESLTRYTRLAADEDTFLEEETGKQKARVVKKEGANLIFDKAELLKLPKALQRQMLRSSIGELAGELKDFEAKHIEDILDIMVKPAGKRITLPGGLIFTVEYDRYLLGFDSTALSPFPALTRDKELTIPGETVLPGWRVSAGIDNRREHQNSGNYSLAADFDFEAVGENAFIRPRRPGDRFQPLGMDQTKKVNEFMIDAKIPRAWRTRIPVVTTPAGIIWVVGYRIDDRVKVTERTRRVLHLKMEPDNGLSRRGGENRGRNRPG